LGGAEGESREGGWGGAWVEEGCKTRNDGRWYEAGPGDGGESEWGEACWRCWVKMLKDRSVDAKVMKMQVSVVARVDIGT